MKKILYSTKEVQGLIENYYGINALKDNHGFGLDLLVRIMDIDRAVYRLPPKEYKAVLLYGQLRAPSRDVEQALEVSRKTLARWYESGISWIVGFLNEGTE